MNVKANDMDSQTWKVLVADDEPEVHAITKMVMNELEFGGKSLELLEAYNSADVRTILESTPDIALILLDVVMETDTSGLDLVKYIRGELGNKLIRIILRTGQPGLAPESRVIIDYDIDDYKEKTELTAQKLKTSVISALRAYRDLLRLETSTSRLAEARSFLRSVITSLSSVLIVIDSNMKVIEWNPTAEQYFSISGERASGKYIYDLIPDLSGFDARIKLALKGEENTPSMDFRYDGSGSECFFNLNIYSLFTPNVDGVILLLNDITEKHRIEEQLRRSQKLEALGSLAAGLAHDVNNALGGITGSVSLIEYEKQDHPEKHNPEYDDYLSTIKHSTERASTMVRHLLSLTKKEELKQEEVDLVRALNNVIKVCRTSFDKRITVTARYGLDEAWILGDSSQLEQIFLNLAINGYHAMTIMRPESQLWEGTLLLSLREIDRRGEPFFRLTVQDTGIGIDPENLEKIFDPFYSTKPHGEGTGLGLATVFKIVSFFNGSIDVVSKKGEGSTFILEFPAYARPEKSEADEEKVLIPKGNGTVLLCDDEILMRKIAEKILKKIGYQVITADDGEEAYERFIENKENISLVILDYQMPKLSGLDTYEKIKKIKPDIKALLSSGFKNEDKIKTAIQQGVKGFLQKPYTMQDLAVMVQDVLHEAEG